MNDFIRIASITVIVPLLVGLLYYSRLGKPERTLIFLFATWTVGEVIGIILGFAAVNNLQLYMIIAIGELLIITAFFITVFESPRARRVMSIMACIGVLMIMTEFIRTGEPLGSSAMIFETLLIFSMGLYAMCEIIIKGNGERYQFLIMTLMFLFLGSGVYFTCFKYMKENIELLRLFAAVHAALLIVCYFLFSVGLWRSRLLS
jgi:hypothetical protein